jgi:hypothetical protein
MYVLCLVFHDDANISFTHITNEFESTFYKIGYFLVVCLFRMFMKYIPYPGIPGIPGKLHFNSRFPGKWNKRGKFPGKRESLVAYLDCMIDYDQSLSYKTRVSKTSRFLLANHKFQHPLFPRPTLSTFTVVSVLSFMTSFEAFLRDTTETHCYSSQWSIYFRQQQQPPSKGK